MNLKKINIEFSAAEVQKVLSIGLDENAEDALYFVREILFKRVEKALRAH
jgi:hypothetical protein